MLKPEDMTYMDISIHRDQIPAFLNEVPNLKLHIVEFKEEQDQEPHHPRREHQFKSDEEIMQHKIHEIEENLIFYFQKMQIDPKSIEPPAEVEKFPFTVKSVDDAIDILHERTTNEIRRLKGYLKENDIYQKKLDDLTFIRALLLKFNKYIPNKTTFTWFNQLEFHLFHIPSDRFVQMEIALENSEIPVVIEYFNITENFTGFFLIYHKSHQPEINEIVSEAKEVENVAQYYDDLGFNPETTEKDMKTAKERVDRAEIALQKAKEEQLRYRAYLEILNNCKMYNSLEQQFRETYRNEIVRVEAFIPSSREKEVFSNLDAKFHDSIRVVAHPMVRTKLKESESNQKSPSLAIGTGSEDYEYTIDEHRLKKVSVPTLIKTKKIFKPFRILIELYGTTNYNELDPTAFVALTYPILFGMMFGDLGHGLFLISIGLIVALLNMKNKESKIYDAGFLLMWLGVFSSIAGILYGEFFGHEIPGIEPLIGNPLDNVINVLKIAIFVGVVHISLGWVLSMINYIQKKQTYLAFADPFMKILVLVGGSYVIFRYSFNIDAWLSPTNFPPYPIILPLIPAVLLLILKPLGRLFGISYLKEESMGEIIGEQAIEVSETFLNILSNVASYSRLLALAMAHVGLMFMVTEITALVEGKWFIVSLIMIFGNLFVIIMETVIAGIHALRLTFYEFFGKFYLGNGIPYQITKIETVYSKLDFEIEDT